MLHKTIRNDDFYRNTGLQHCCDIVSNGYNIVPIMRRCVALKIVFANRPVCRLRAVSLFSWSVEQNARDTQITTRVTEGARRERLPPSFLASRGVATQRSRARAVPLLNLKKKRGCSQSIPCDITFRELKERRFK